MAIVKPQRGILPNKCHPLSRGLAGLYLYNENTGDKAFDLSGNNNTGTLYYDTHFVPGVFGSALDFDGSSDHVKMNPLSLSEFTFSLWLRADIDDFGYTRCLVYNNIDGGTRGELTLSSTSNRVNLYVSNSLYYYFDGIDSDNGNWHSLIVTYDGIVPLLYFDGVKYESDGNGNPTDDTSIAFRIGIRGGGSASFGGRIDHVAVYDRALSEAEALLLYRGPFCMFDDGISVAVVCGHSAYVNLAGSCSVQSSLAGKLTVSCMTPEPERPWRRDALFAGITARAFRLGTVLTSGWFWMRVCGCAVLYRGGSMEQIDFGNILEVAEADAVQIKPPNYIPHEAGSTYFYVVRRFNGCGLQERTLSAAAKVSIKLDGSLQEPLPNKIFATGARQTGGDKIRLDWFYCPLEQKSTPVCFRLYYDNASGQFDYENPLSTIEFSGRKFYSYEISQLAAGRYLFAVRAENADGLDDGSQAGLEIELVGQNPEPVEILETEVI